MKRLMIAGVVIAVLGASTGYAQRRYELVVEGTNVVSLAERTPQRLIVVDRAGMATQYQRERRYDAADRSYLGYVSQAAQQIVRWPATDEGRMLIADLRGNPPRFRASQMVIRPTSPDLEDVAGTAFEPDQPYRLSPLATNTMTPPTWPSADALDVGPDGRLFVRSIEDRDAQLWQFHALDDGFYRIHSGLKGHRWSLTAGRDGVPRLERTARDPRQLWQIMPVPGRPGFSAFTCWLGGPHPVALTVGPGGFLVQQPFSYAATQMWRCRPFVGPPPAIFAEYRFISREIRPNPPLEPAQVEFVNDHDKELWVLVTDRLNPAGSLRLKIPAGKSEVRPLVRDAGGTLVEVYESVSALGVVQREELVTPLPPGIRYDLSVYELFLQSIAIDRTVPGGKIEDVNYAPKSVGWFELPPGVDLPSGPLPLFETARQQKNPGGVRKIDPAEWQAKNGPPDPVEALLNEFRNREPK